MKRVRSSLQNLFQSVKDEENYSMLGGDKFANRLKRDDLSRRQRCIRKLGLAPEKYVLGHGGDLIYHAWIGNTPDFLSFTKIS